MMKTHIKVGFLRLIPFLVLAGCANNPHLSPTLTPEVRASLGKVTVQSASSGPRTSVEKPYTPGKAAAAGAMDALSGIGGSGGGGDFGGVVMVMVPIAAVVGGTVGGMHGTPDAEAQTEWQLLSNSCAKLDFQRALRRDVIATMGKYTRIPMAQPGQSGASGNRTADTLLELRVLQAGLAGKRYKNSQITAFIQAQTRLVRLSDGKELYNHIWTETAGKHTYSEWASRDAGLFRQELSHACANMAVRIVRGIFMAQPLPDSGWLSKTRERKRYWPY